MGGPNLEIFKVNPTSRCIHHGLLSSFQFGLYIMFPIGWMYYFGTNLEERFNIPDFWPAPETTHKIPFDRDEIQAEAVRLRVKRLAKRARRLGAEGEVEATGEKQQLVVDKKEESRWSLDRGAWELGRH